MKAMFLTQVNTPLIEREVDRPRAKDKDVVIEVSACGVCRTDLHVLDGELPNPKLPLILGHEVIGRIVETSPQVSRLTIGQLVGVPWLAKTCHQCQFCLSGQENLCDKAIFTGYTKDGGYAEFICADEEFCFPIPENYDQIKAAPLLCAGLIGWRSYKMIGEAKKIGIYGFGGAAHILTQIACFQGKEIFAFTRSGDTEGQRFAKSVGAVWAGDSETAPPVLLDGALIFAPVGSLVLSALKAVRKGATVVCGGIYMSAIPPISYDLIWGERHIRSVANLTRADGLEFMQLISKQQIEITVHPYALERANDALTDLRAGKFSGAAVLIVNS
jgi:alcohol dehydrogenase, propanol-preferring